jgi:tRNA-splicing ligase RtcB (3'-phosphate/5'-hydroxy nucleic acid ligase)
MRNLKNLISNPQIFNDVKQLKAEVSAMFGKGAVSAKKGELLLIPINMRDGSLLCIGKGNEDWNFSAPHGAGRLMSRARAKKEITLEQFKESMSTIHSSSISEETLDEAPQAYKSIEEIKSLIGETVDIIGTIKTVYNFKL